MVKKADIILLTVIIAFSLLLCLIPFNSKNGKTLVISVNNEEYARFPISEDKIITLQNNTVIIEDGYVYMTSANCPDKVCINRGKINKKGETIICLPNKTVLEVE